MTFSISHAYRLVSELPDDEIIFSTIQKMMVRDEWPRLYLVQRTYAQKPLVSPLSSSSTVVVSKLRNNATVPVFFNRNSFTMIQISAQTVATDIIAQMQFLLGIEEEHEDEYILVVNDGYKGN